MFPTATTAAKRQGLATQQSEDETTPDLLKHRKRVLHTCCALSLTLSRTNISKKNEFRSYFMFPQNSKIYLK